MSALDPRPETLERWLEQVSRFVMNHLAAIPDQPAQGLIGAEGRAIADEVSRPISEEPALDMEAALQVLERAASASLNTPGPGYLAYVPGGGLPASAMAELLAATVNRFTGLSQAAPALARLEGDVLRWLAGEVGFGPDARGILTSGGSMANFGGVVTARTAKLGDSGDFREATVLVSAQVHHSVEKAARLAGIPPRNVHSVAVDGHLRMDMDALREAVERHRPFLIVASAGTTNTGAIDPLHAIADLCAEAGIWMHVDGAYGGTWYLCERGRQRLSGMERADSLSLDPHKGLFLPYGTGCLLVKRGEALADAHAGSAHYLQDFEDAAVPSPSDYGPELSRPFRGLRLWLPLMLHGARAFREALDEKLTLSERTYDAFLAQGLDVVVPPQLTTIAFRLPRDPGEGLADWNARNEAYMGRINARGRVYLSSTDLDGVFTLRVCIVSFRTHGDHITWLIEDVREAR